MREVKAKEIVLPDSKNKAKWVLEKIQSHLQ